MSLDDRISSYRRDLDSGHSIVVASYDSLPPPALALCERDCAGPIHYHGFQAAPILRDGTGSTARLILGTSGVTGSRKLVAYDLDTIFDHARAISVALDLNASSRYTAFCPPGFAYGLSVINSHHVSAVQVSFRHSANHQELSDQINNSTDVDVYYLLPSQLADLVLSGARSKSHLTLVVAGGFTPPNVVALLQDRFPNARLINMYGKAELGPRLAIWSGQLSQFEIGSIGHPLASIRFRISHGGLEGELAVHSPWRATWIAEAPYGRHRTLPQESDGWVATGDLVQSARDGWRFVKRGDRIANIGGALTDLDAIRLFLETEFKALHVTVNPRAGRVTGDVMLSIEITTERPEQISVPSVKIALSTLLGTRATLASVRISREISRNEAAK